MGNKKRGVAWDKRKWVAINVGIGYAVRTRDNRSFVVLRYSRCDGRAR